MGRQSNQGTAMTTNLLSVIDQQQKALKELLSVPNDDSPESVARCILSHTRARKAIAAGKQALEQTKEYSMRDWFNDLDNPHANR